ncbi:MAG: hypothetical protein RL685_2690 [Pseudomonadota bacterium]|jgi:hypothetical protein
MVATTPLSRDVLSRYTCNTWEEATQSPGDIDVVVIGAGMYGGYAASKIHELSKARGVGAGGLRVLLLDAGPFLLPEHAENVPFLGLFAPNAQPCGPRSSPRLTNEVWGIGWRSFENFVGQAYCVGGKGLFWGGWCPRLRDADLALWPQDVRDYLTQVQASLPTRPITHTESVTGVTFSRGDLLSGYEALEYEIGVKPSDDFIYDPKGAQLSQSSAPTTAPSRLGLNGAFFELARSLVGNVPDLLDVQVAPIAVQTQSYISGLFSLDKYSSVPAIIASARQDHGGRPPNRIAVVPDAHVVRLECAPSGEAGPAGTRLIQSILVRNDGEQKRLPISPHCQVVLALGCIESTRLALESFSLASNGLALHGERMGRNYMIHYREDFEFSVDRAKLAAWVATLPGSPTLDTAFHQAALHLQFESPRGRVHLQLYAAAGGAPDPAIYRMIPDLDAQARLSINTDPNRISLILRGIAEQAGEASLILPSPNRDLTVRDSNFGFIDLAGAADFDFELGHQRAWVQFPSNADAAAIWGDMFNGANEFCRRLLSTIGDTVVNVTARGHQGFGTTFHDSGTLWMGDDPDSSVTDANGHFHHVSNAYCTDQALFPTVGSANPVLTGLALTRKVVEDIVSKHESQRPSTAPAGFTTQSVRTNWLSYPYPGMLALPGLEVLETRPNGGLGLYYLPTALTDFEVFLEWKAFRGSGELPNSGVLFRLPDPQGVNFSDESALQSYFAQAVEVQIDESGKNYRGAGAQPPAIFGDSRFKTGAAYGLAPARQWAAKALSPEGTDSYWNEFHITLVADRLEVRLNNKLVCKTVLPASKVHPGFFGLQFHTGKVQFRNIRRA